MSTELTRYMESIERHVALAYAPPPFALVKGKVRRTEWYVVVMRYNRRMTPVEIARSELSEGTLSEQLLDALTMRTVERVLHVIGKRGALSRDVAEALLADVCADLRRGGKVMRQWCETLPFQVILARAKLRDIKTYNFDVAPVLYASGPRWCPTKERPADETP